MKLKEMVKWYDFRENASVLEMDENFEAEKCKEQFDYILLKDDIYKLQGAKKLLKADGKILFLVNNRFGIRYFAGDKKNGKSFSTICAETADVYGKKEIEQILESFGFADFRFFYLLPGYESPSSVFSDEYLPDYTNPKLLYHCIYQENSVAVFNELEALKQITKAGEFCLFANSYCVEINPSKQPKFVSFNYARKPEYQLITKMYDEVVVKEVANEKAKMHIANMENYIEELRNKGIEIIDKAENGKIISQYKNLKTLFRMIIEEIQKEKIAEAYALMEKWYDFMKTKFEKDTTDSLNENIEDDEQLSKKLTILKKAYIDLVFENTFLEDGKIIFFDQEWAIPNLPLEFILYRAIHNLYIYHSEIGKILPIKECLEHFKILEFLELFRKMEDYVQSLVIDTQKQENAVVTPIVEDIKALLDEKQNLVLDNQKLREEKDQIQFAFGEQKQLLNAKMEYIGELEKYEREKDSKIENLQETLGLVKVDNEKKQEYIVSLEEYKTVKDKENQDLNEVIKNLNEIIKVKDSQIQAYENMKLVKLTKKVKSLKK